MEKAFLDTIESHQALIYKVSRLYRYRKEDQEDLFQEIVFQLWQAYPSFRGESKVSTWMYRIALNTALSAFRRKGPDPIAIGLEYGNDFPETPQNFGLDEPSENELRLFEALSRLSQAEKAVVSLFLEDYSYREIGEVLGITENNVGVRMNRIRKKLKMTFNL